MQLLAWLPPIIAERILLRPILRDYGGQVASAYAKASVDKPAYAKALSSLRVRRSSFSLLGPS